MNTAVIEVALHKTIKICHVFILVNIIMTLLWPASTQFDFIFKNDFLDNYSAYTDTTSLSVAHHIDSSQLNPHTSSHFSLSIEANPVFETNPNLITKLQKIACLEYGFSLLRYF